MCVMRRLDARLLPFVLVGVSLAAAIALPSHDVNGDAFDKLLSLEKERCPSSPKHPAAEPAGWLLMRALRHAGYAGRALRPIQLCNGVWMSLALAAIFLFARQTTRSRAATAGVVLLAAGCYAWLHLVLDPYLFYWPPSLAGLLWAAWLVQGTTTAKRGWVSWAAALLCLVGAVLFNPMIVMAVPAVAATCFATDARLCPARARVRGLCLVLAPALALGVAMRRSGSTGAGEIYGRWRLDTWQSAMFGAKHALLAHSYHLDGSRWKTLGVSLLGIAKVGLVPAGLALLWLMVRSGRPGLRLGVWWGLGAAVGAIFVAWWDPAQGQFWLLPVLLLLMGVAAAQAQGQPAPTRPRLAHVVLVAEGAMLLLANSIGYAVPSAVRADTHAAVAIRIAARFARTDILIYPGFSDPYLAYYAGLPGDCMIGFYFQKRARPELASSLDALAEFIAHSKAEGRRVFLQTRADGLPEIPPWVMATGVDYRVEDFLRIEWGQTVSVEGQTFRQALAVRR